VLRLRQADYELHSKTFSLLPGADTLIRAFGKVPSFHDAEVETVRLSKKGASSIRLSIHHPDFFGGGHLFVTLSIAEIIDGQLDGFSPQNVLGAMRVRPAPERPEREEYYRRKRRSDDMEIELEPIYGMGGNLVGQGLTVGWTMDRRARQAKPGPSTTLLGQ
jgi:hypothetical protein